MAWEHLSITKPHLVYIILGGFTSLFMLCSSVIKERMYIGEATVATICGLIFGPHAANLIDPKSWGSVDIVTIEFSRIVLVVQCFAVGVELPKFYMERHWKSVVFLLVPVMTFGWLITSLFVWWMIPMLSWLDSLVIAACVTATDPVLASSVVGKGKFAKRVPKHLRDLLSAESGCNDGMAFPFVYLSLYLLQDHLVAGKVTFHWIVYTILYECVFGALFGFTIGYAARHGIKYAEKHDLIDRESFLVFYFTLALFCAGSGSILGVDDLLVGFSAGVGFSNDGWFGQKTEESHVSNVIDLLLNLAYFVFLGTIIPWEMFNDASIGLSAWRLTVIAILVIFFRRIPIMMALKPLIPDIKTWREALFAGHFGPIGVGAIFVAILARAELETGDPVPLAELPPADTPHFALITLVWPVTTFLVVASILVHGSSIAVFTLGKHINTLTLTMSYTTAHEDGPSWMNRLPRITSLSRSQARTMSDTDVEEGKLPEVPPGTLPPIGFPGHFLRRVREEDRDGAAKQGSRSSSLAGRRRRKKWDDGIGPGGPISQSAIFPQRRTQSDLTATAAQEESPDQSVHDSSPTNQRGASETDSETQQHSPEQNTAQSPGRGQEVEQEQRVEGGQSQDQALRQERHSPGERGEPRRRVETELEVYDEGDHIIVEASDGEVVAVEPVSGESNEEAVKKQLSPDATSSGWSYDSIKKRLGNWRDEEIEKRKEKEKKTRRHEPARAYQFGNTIIVEDEDGEVVKKYELPATHKSERDGGDLVAQGLKYMGMGSLVKGAEKAGEAVPPAGEAESSSAGASKSAGKAGTVPNWANFKRTVGADAQRSRKKSVAEEAEEEDDLHIRFTIGGVGQRMTKADFIHEMQKLDRGTRREVVDQSSASHRVKALAKQDARSDQGLKSSPSPGDRGKETIGDRAPGNEDGDGETAVERRRRLAVLEETGSAAEGAEGVDGDEGSEGNEVAETPAERRRREAALGISMQGEGSIREEDSDDDNTPRVSSTRRGIRFADAPEKNG